MSTIQMSSRPGLVEVDSGAISLVDLAGRGAAAVVTRVDGNLPLRPGDAVLAIDGRSVHGADDALRILSQGWPGAGRLLRVRRGVETVHVLLPGAAARAPSNSPRVLTLEA